MASMTRRQFLAKTVTYAAGAALLGAGCGPRGVPGARVTLTQWYHQYGEEGTQDAVHRYAQAYTKLHPDIAIEVTWVPGDYGTKLATALLTPQGPDVFENQLSQAMVDANQLAPLDDLFTPQTRADFTDKDLAVNTVRGKIYGVKELDDIGLLYYRKSLFSAAGIEPPATLDALMDAAKKLSSDSRKGLFIGNDGGISALLTILPWSAGGDFLVDDKIVFNTPRAAATYEKLRAMNDSGALLIGAPTDWWDPSAFTSGLCAMQWTGLWAYPKIKKALGDDAGAIPWPAFDTSAGAAPVTFLSGWSAMVNAQNRNVDEAKKYVKWMWVDSNPAIQNDWCLSYGFHVPPHVSQAKTATPLRTPVAATAVKAATDSGRIMPPLWNAAMGTALTDALSNIVKNGAPAEGELAVAARKCERELERALE